MLLDEAEMIGYWAQALPLGRGSVCLNLGSSTRKFREETQPFIATKILHPLQERGYRIINCDLKLEDGVDEVGDLLDPVFQQRLMVYRPDLIICSNLLEHLADPRAFAQACGIITKPGGYCLFTVPRSFPYHPDPLDTMYRPTTQQIADLLPGWETVAAKELVAGSYRQELLEQPDPVRALVRQIARAMLPMYRPRTWYPAAHKLMWLFRLYRVSLVMLKKPEHGRAADSQPSMHSG